MFNGQVPCGILTAVKGNQGVGGTYHYNASWWVEPLSSVLRVLTADEAGTCSSFSASAPHQFVAAKAHATGYSYWQPVHPVKKTIS